MWKKKLCNLIFTRKKILQTNIPFSREEKRYLHFWVCNHRTRELLGRWCTVSYAWKNCAKNITCIHCVWIFPPKKINFILFFGFLAHALCDDSYLYLGSWLLCEDNFSVGWRFAGFKEGISLFSNRFPVDRDMLALVL